MNLKIVTLERIFQWIDAGKLQLNKSKNESVKKSLDMIYCDQGGEKKNIKKDAKSKKRVFFFLWKIFLMYLISLKAYEKVLVGIEHFNMKNRKKRLF